MDPNKGLNQLDPKLKEAYERVMGTANAAQGTAPQQPAQTPAAATPPPAPASSQTASNPYGNLQQDAGTQASPQMVTSPASASYAPTPPPVFQSFNASAPQQPQATAGVKSKQKISLPILIVLGLMFFAVYAVLWMKVFKIF